MEFIADGLMVFGALIAALYCYVLSRRLSALRSMDQGLGGAIAGLSARVEQTKASLADTKATTTDLTRELSAVTARAEIAAGRLELLLATLHDSSADTAPKDTKAVVTHHRAAAAEATPEPADDTPPAPESMGTTKGDLVSALRRIADGGRRA